MAYGDVLFIYSKRVTEMSTYLVQAVDKSGMMSLIKCQKPVVEGGKEKCDAVLEKGITVEQWEKALNVGEDKELWEEYLPQLVTAGLVGGGWYLESLFGWPISSILHRPGVSFGYKGFFSLFGKLYGQMVNAMMYTGPAMLLYPLVKNYLEDSSEYMSPTFFEVDEKTGKVYVESIEAYVTFMMELEASFNGDESNE